MDVVCDITHVYMPIGICHVKDMLLYKTPEAEKALLAQRIDKMLNAFELKLPGLLEHIFTIRCRVIKIPDQAYVTMKLMPSARREALW